MIVEEEEIEREAMALNPTKMFILFETNQKRLIINIIIFEINGGSVLSERDI